MAAKFEYKFSNRKHSTKGIMSTVFGSISLISLIVVVVLSYLKKGDVPIGYGFTGLFAAVFSTIGLTLGIMAVKEWDKFKVFGWIGIGINGVTLAMVSGILYMAASL